MSRTRRHIQRLYDARFPITVFDSSWLTCGVRQKKTMLPLAYLETVEFRDLDEQRASFLFAASAVILVSWGLIRLKKWLGTVALIGALVSGLLIISEVRWTKGWHFPHTPVHLPLMYLVTAYLSAALPVFAVIALLMARKNRDRFRSEVRQ